MIASLPSQGGQMRCWFFLLLCCFFVSLSGVEADLPYTETYLQKSEKQEAPFLLFLHGAASDKGVGSIAKSWFDHWVEKGYSVGAISMPGYGNTTGQKDFCGPVTIAFLRTALEAMKHELGVTEFGIIGFGQGSQAGILLAGGRDDVTCLVCSNGIYDLLRHLSPDDLLVQTLIMKNYAVEIEEEAFKMRSPMERVANIKTPVFILHRAGHPITSEDEVREFAERLRHAGQECIFSVLPASPGRDVQKISYEEILRETETWIDTKMGLLNP